MEQRIRKLFIILKIAFIRGTFSPGIISQSTDRLREKSSKVKFNFYKPSVTNWTKIDTHSYTGRSEESRGQN